ncbi:MAG TPA: pyruvate, phosphate dikinase, partial [Candidatus Saccharicenans sp.]|nr:pyruvate, phosphate dikinase [Candidatus Saccharicenans sp.]
QKGVGLLMKWAVEKGRETKPELKVGICGVHGGDPRSITYCHKIGLNYVSCSAYQIPIARLAAAQIAIQEKKASLEEKSKKTQVARKSAGSTAKKSRRARK